MRSATLLILLACSPAWAADWVPLQINSNDAYFYDNSKLVIKDDEITYWKKVQFKTPQMHKGSEVVTGVLRERIHCGEHTAKLISYLYYSPGGETVEYVAQDDSAPVPIVPDTVGDAYDRVLCPMVWRKQEEVRIRSEQKAAEAESQVVKEEEKTAPAPGKLPVKDNRPAATVKVPKTPVVAPPKAPEGKQPAAKPVEKMPLPLPQIPEPQILDNLY